MASMPVPRAAFIAFLLGALLACGTAGAGEVVLSCVGKSPGLLERPMRFRIELHQANIGVMTIVDEQRAHRCRCVFVLDSLFDLTNGHVPKRTVNLRKRGCEKSCEVDVSRHVPNTISVTHYLIRNERYAVPFIGSRIAPCDSFSMDLERLRKMEHERIDRMDVSEEVKQKIKDIKQVHGGYSSPEAPAKDPAERERDR